MNLLSKLHKNSILTGPIESYCLACGCLLRSEEESYAHIHLPHHVDKLQALPHLDGYKDDCIIKIKEGYFCPYCNIILPTIKRISLHVVELKHKENKMAQSITRHADTIFLFDIVVIGPRSWHGVDGATCSVCNEDYSDEKKHTTEPGHALKLIQAKCEFGDNYVYRDVDEDLFFCLICKYILPITDKESHSNSKIHKELYKKSSTEGAAIITELNNNIAEEKSANTLSEVKPKDANTNVKSIKDSKDSDNNNPKKQVSKVDNGSPRVVDDDRTTVKTDSQQFNPNRVNLDTEKTQTQVPNTEPTNKTKDIAKISTQIKDTLNQEAPKITSPKVIQVAKIDSKSNEDTSKVNEKVKNQNNDIQKKSTQDLKKVQESKDSNEKAQETTKNIEVQTKELKDAATSSPNVPKTKITESVKPASVKLDTNGTAKDPGSAEPYLYEFLKSINFVVRTVDGEAFCTLCDVSVDVADIGIHCVDKHHSILYQKHIAKKNKLSEKNGQDIANIKKETNNKIATGKENTVPAIEKTKAQKDASKIDKPVEASTNNVGKEANVVDESTDKNNQVVQKEIVAPENKVGDERIPVSQPTPKIKNVPSRQKSTKKAQKKAAKKDITNKIRDTRDPALDDNFVSVNEKATETNETSVTVTEKTTDTNETSFTVTEKTTDTNETPVTVTGKASETNEASVTVTEKTTDTNETSFTVTEKTTETNETPVTVTGKASETNEASVTVTGKATELNETSVNENETPENTRNNDPVEVNGTTNDTIPDVKVKTEKLLIFIKTMSQVDSSPGDVVINCKYVVGNLSFVLLVRTGDKVECVACNEMLTVDVYNHISTEEHMIKFEDCTVVTSLDDEFIRQVKTEKYHCGYCNLTLADWEETKAHLETYRHSDAKTSASWRLERYLPHMKHCEKKEVRSVLTAVFRRTME